MQNDVRASFMLINILEQGVIRFKSIYHEFFERGLKREDCQELHQLKKVCCESGESQETRESAGKGRNKSPLKHEQLKLLYRVVITDDRGMG